MTSHLAPSSHRHPYQLGAGLGLFALAVPLLWWVSHPDRLIAINQSHFLFWHTVAELLAVVVAMLIFITGYRPVLSPRKGAVVWLGLAFLGVGLLDLLHLMSYAGMPDAITANTPQKSIVFWLAARLLAAVAMLVYALLPAMPDMAPARKQLALAVMLAMVGAIGYTGLLWPDHLPTMFIPGQGLTPLKIRVEWVLITLNLITLLAFWLRRKTLGRECLMALAFAVGLSAVSELFFTLFGVVDQDSANAIGHAYKVAAYLYLFHATYNESLRRPLAQLNMQHLREKVTLTAAPDGVLWVDQQGCIKMANPAMQVLSGYTQQELLGQNVAIFLPPHLRERHADSMRDYFHHPRSRAMGEMDLKLLRRDGQLLPVDISLGHWEDDGEHHAIAYIRDLSERKKFEESLQYQATHDVLTGLPNRWLFQLQLKQALERAERNGLRVAILFLDLDHFKSINDTFGHAVGDALLVQVSNRLRVVLRASDTLARMGGDEFAVLLPDLAHVEEAISVAMKVLACMGNVFELTEHQIYSGISAGLAYYPDDARDNNTLLRYADLAMYQAKQAGRGGYACYSGDMDQRAHEDMRLHTRLKEALSQGLLKLHYQPQVDVKTGRIVSAEALLRWQDPILGRVSPARFIPIAEATGLMLPLSDWVLETACSQIAAWAQAGIPLRVAVNFSATQFHQRHLLAKVRAILERTGAQAQWLDIEITESVAMAQPEQAREQIKALVALGCSMALDDFGTGYSSLAYLKALPVSKLKIDKSFMDGIPHDPNDVTISKAIIALAHSLGLTLVAEGVEKPAQLAFLRQHGCEAYQGWLFSRAVDATELTKRLHEQRS